MINQKKYPPVNQCIYCGSTNKKLTDEHIIAYGLNANSILPKASCLDCNKITSRIENSVMRGFAWQMRTALGFPTRRPKEAPQTFKLGLVKNNVESVIDVPVEDHPIVLPMPMYKMPVYFDNQILNKNREYKEGIELAGIQAVWFADIEKIRKRHDAESISILHKLDHISFARMLAKIAYCLAVAELGIESFDEVFVLPSIKGERNDIGLWVGSSEQVMQAESNIAHQTQVQTYKKPDGSDSIIIALIKLFAHISTFGYIVIIGRPK